MPTIVVIPARLASSRLPGKALADIHGEPMIVHAWRRGIEANVGPVVVACGDAAIADAIWKAGGDAVLTDPALPSGSDRVCAALQQIDPARHYQTVINLQGDMPTVCPAALVALTTPFDDAAVDIGTLATPIQDATELHTESVVKVCASLATGATSGRCLYFSRHVLPWGAGPHLHHVGLYGYRRSALERYASLPVGPLEARERLEQLRALENGLRIDVSVVDIAPLGVDTPEDLEAARIALQR